MDGVAQLTNLKHSFPYHEGRALFMRYATLVLSVVALVANGFVLFLARRLKARRGGFSEQLVTYIAMVDLLNSVTMVVGFGGGAWLGFPGTFLSPWYCRSVGLLLTQFPCYSMIMISFLACERFYVIKYRQSFDGLVTKAWALMATFIACLAVPSVANAVQNAYSPDPTFSYCWPHSMAPGFSWATAQNMVSTVIFVEPLFVLVFCYVQVAVVCLQPINAGASDQRLSPRGARHSLIFIVIYVLCFGPKVLTTLFFMTGNGASHPFALYMINPISLQLLICINPILLMFLSKNFRREAIRAIAVYWRLGE